MFLVDKMGISSFDSSFSFTQLALSNLYFSDYQIKMFFQIAFRVTRIFGSRVDICTPRHHKFRMLWFRVCCICRCIFSGRFCFAW